MKRVTMARGRESLAALPHAEPPWLRFRAMAPVEQLLALAREQDALCRGVLAMDRPATRVEIERELTDGGVRHRVVVRANRQHIEHCGGGQHESAEVALREAYTALVRNAARAVPCPCAAA